MINIETSSLFYEKHFIIGIYTKSQNLCNLRFLEKKITTQVL